MGCKIPLARFASGYMRKLRACLNIVCVIVCFCFMGLFSICLFFSSGVNASFIGVTITKWVIQFFCYLISAFFGMLWYQSCTIVCLSVCLLFCFLILYAYLRACLIFCSRLMLYLIVFFRHITHICNCLILQVVGGVTFSFRAVCVQVGFIIFVVQTFIDVCYVMLNLLYLVVGCLLGFSGSFRACFFAMQISLLHQFALARFRFVLFRCLFFCLNFTYAHPCRPARLFFPFPSLRTTLSDHQTIPVYFLVYCVVCMHSKCALFLPIYYSFCLVFASDIDHTFIRPHLHQSVSICAHSHHFLHILPKHDVRGNFPGHRTQILVFKTIYAPCLPCFCVPCAQCTPTHQSAPIRIHSHLFLPVCTLSFHVHIHNLMKK